MAEGKYGRERDLFASFPSNCMRGTVDYTNYDDMKYAIRKLDDSLFRNQFSLAYIRVEEYGSRCSYSRSLSRSPYSRSRSPSRSSGYRDMNRSVSPTGSYSRCASSRSHSQSVTSLSEAGSPPCSVPSKDRLNDFKLKRLKAKWM
ncbi:hypothetical protein Pfo_005228 [Paulownia fortunei]|nr:hypothetical protein Pfo_005228 [Paulownia fortunei]